MRFLSLIFLLSFSLFKSQKCYDLKTVLKVEPTELYKPHLLASQNFGVNILENTKSVDKYIAKGKFVKVKKKSRGYRLQTLEYSRPYLVKKARTTLERMANDFAAKTKSFFVVSSVTRTLEDQCRLRKVNSNASLGISSHNYGAAFDISYVRFDHKLKVNPKLEKELEKVLTEYKNLGKIFYIKEKQQSCYHVTVRNY
ncbi:MULTISPECIES: DUF5715 family protein [Epilithonimonas]|uniref:D-alanyl-D-alanine carboxypeptidase-like protein n=1 Tax=Epilithonimonas arachidiradicis TaxID=1617282 RepID=A0A420D9T7_9FLAO|nr:MULTISPECIES: DUF5715 family protein [Epilithonimonas]RKE87792.1 hypothetical protein BXY58_1928 [Epilithonimonas arachidiradicis]UQB70412.1 hypothetical protein KI430_08295 [Epilithonimonas zeae]GGG57923.1 hypothetical protein GCM10007332_19580 [Epilithonimonas arachidiradicis]